ncbi:MAG: amylo-alpha-1,6-glucosidase [bacterium]
MEEKLFLLTNNNGNYIALGNSEFSNFLGLFHFLPEKWTLYKTIENISIDLLPENIINNYDSIERINGKTKEKFYYKDTDIIYEVTNYTGYINIDLDFREIYDFDDTNRIYEITRENDNLKILYKKDGKSLTINGVKEYINIGQWVKKEYPYDKKRNGKSEFYIYKALKIKVQNNIKLVFSFKVTQASSLSSSSSSFQLENSNYEIDNSIYFDPNDELGIHQRNLPHWEQKGKSYFVTFRLNDSIPKEVADNIKKERNLWLKQNGISDTFNIEKLSKEKQKEYYCLFSRRYDKLLDNSYGSCVLDNPKCKEIVENAIMYFDNERYYLDKYIIMPNHVHVIVIPKGIWTLTQILHSWKSFTANEINKLLHQKTELWMHESFDHIIRSPEQLEKIRKYIKDNPKNSHKQDACDTEVTQASSLSSRSNSNFRLESFKHKQDACDTLVNQASSLSNETNALKSLVTDTPAGIGIFAGFPWFFQFWARDELISTGAIIVAGQYELAKSILSRYLNSILEDGRLSNWYAPSPPSLGSADAIGWLFHRLSLLLKTLNSKHSLNKYFSKKELTEIEKTLHNSVDNIYRNYGQTGLIRNNKKETWMDTIPRAGYRIEIQALQLSMLKAINYISTLTKTNTLKYTKMEQELKKEVKSKFFVNGMLSDGIDESGNLDTTIRPNIFIASYLYPELLTKNEWKSVFSETLKKLWLKWGGLSTIDINNPLYCDEYTGQDDRSYHNGDSWFFVNNLAAISMYRIDKVYFNTYIKDILKASTTEMLSYGFIGHCAELSSAKKLNPCGCLAQAWSSATLVELTSEVKNGNIKIK